METLLKVIMSVAFGLLVGMSVGKIMLTIPDTPPKVEESTSNELILEMHSEHHVSGSLKRVSILCIDGYEFVVAEGHDRDIQIIQIWESSPSGVCLKRCD